MNQTKKSQQTFSKNYELCADILATFSILEKWGFDEITSNLVTFTSFLNELGFRTPNGLEITSSNLSNIFRINLKKEEKESLLEEFNKGFNHLYIMQEQVAAKIIH